MFRNRFNLGQKHAFLLAFIHFFPALVYHSFYFGLAKSSNNKKTDLNLREHLISAIKHAFSICLLLTWIPIFLSILCCCRLFILSEMLWLHREQFGWIGFISIKILRYKKTNISSSKSECKFLYGKNVCQQKCFYWVSYTTLDELSGKW